MSDMLYAEEDDDGEVPQSSVLPVEGHHAFHRTHMYKNFTTQRSAGQRRDEEARQSRQAERAEKVEKEPTVQEAMKNADMIKAKSKKLPAKSNSLSLSQCAFNEDVYCISGATKSLSLNADRLPSGQNVERKKHVFVLFERESATLGEGYVVAYRGGKNEYVPYPVLCKEDNAMVINRSRNEGSVCFEELFSMNPFMETLVIYDLPQCAFKASPMRGLSAREPLTALQNISILSHSFGNTNLSFCRLDRKPFTYRFIESLFEFFSQDGNQFVENFTKLANCDEFCWLDTIRSTENCKFAGYGGKILSIWELLKKCRELRVLSVEEMKYWHGPNPLRAWPFLKEFIGSLKSSLVRRWDFSGAQYLETIEVEIELASVYFNNPLLKDVKVDSKLQYFKSVVEFGHRCVQLQSLEVIFHKDYGPDSAVKSLRLNFPSELPNLRTMKLHDVTVGEEFAQGLANCNSLQEFEMWGGMSLCDLKLPKAIVKIRFFGSDSSHESIIFPPVMPLLFDMTILRCESVVFPEEAPRLRRIDISHAKMDILNITGAFPVLTHLRIGNCISLTTVTLSIKCGRQCRINASGCNSLKTMDLTVEYLGKKPRVHTHACNNLEVVRSNLPRAAFDLDHRNKKVQLFAANDEDFVEEEEEAVESDGSDF